MDGLSDKMRAFRDRNSLSQAELAERIGCNQSTVHRIEAGEMEPRGAIKMMILRIISGQFNTRPASRSASGPTALAG